ncbi:MAG: hypothetical protein AB7E85_06505 [Pseudobdellovibrionaceae bacterium]
MQFGQQEFWEVIGLGRHDNKPYTLKKLRIDKGEIDPASHGGIALFSRGAVDESGNLEDFQMYYWVIYPDGRLEKQNLFEIETSVADKGRVELTHLSILGRSIPLYDQRSVNNVLEAIRRIHVSLRDREPELPHVAKIFADCRIEDAVGEYLTLPGFSKTKRLHFAISPSFSLAAVNGKRPEMILPAEAIGPLQGLRKNTIDRAHAYRLKDGLKTRGILPQVGHAFEMNSSFSRKDRQGGKTRHQRLEISHVDSEAIGKDARPRTIVKTRWETLTDKSKTGGDDTLVKLTKLKLLDRNALSLGFREAMAALGVINRTHADMLKSRDYPRMQDYLATYGHLDAATSSAHTPPRQGRFVLTSMGGNNLREIYPGIGEDIGGNCKVCETQWYDLYKDEVKKLGVIFDLGAYIIKTKSHWTGGGPDIVEKLKYCKDIFISHHHLDHLDFLIPYIKRSIITAEHRLHMTPEVYEFLKDKMTKWDIKKGDPRLPQINLLEGTGVIDLADEKGTIRMSVMYGTDAVPHSAKDTPFIAYGRNADTILGSYMYLGDMRYDEDWFAIHDSPFWDPVKVMLNHDPKLEPDHLVPTYTEVDGTSAKYEGHSPREAQVEDNIVHMINNWFYDRHVAMPIIGTNDGRRESILNMLNRTGRKGTAFGAAVEFLFRIANKHGVNPYRLARPAGGKYTGIKDYLKWHAEQNDLTPSQFAGRTSKKVAEWFEYDRPGSLLAVLSGSQGNPVEIESATYKAADARFYFDANPAHSKTARPADMRQWVFFFSQSAIPGNAKYQKALIKKLAGRGATVVENFGDNIRIHNAGSLKKRIADDLAAQGRPLSIEADGALMIEGYPAHASGHGRNGDFRQWLKKLRAKQFGLHHTDDRETVLVAYETILEEGKATPGDIFENGIEVQITTDDVKQIGKTHSSVVLTREIAEDGKQYNRQLDAVRTFNFDDRSPHNDLGLRGSAGGAFETAFGVENIEDVRARAHNMGTERASFNRSAATHAIPRRRSRRTVFATPSWTPPTGNVPIAA